MLNFLGNSLVLTLDFANTYAENTEQNEIVVKT